jgi:hypothetical protein
MKYALSLILVLFCLSSFSQKNYRFAPHNEAGQDASLKVFVDTLKQVIARKDAPALLKLLSPNIQIYFEEKGNNIKGFVDEYKPADTASQVWSLMSRIVGMGGVFDRDYKTGKPDKDVFILPYVAQMNIKHAYCEDCSSCIATIAPDVNVREKTDRLSASVGKLNYEVVKVVEDPASKQMGGDSRNWTYIQTFDGKITGWVRNDMVYSPCSYRIFLQKTNRKWLVTTFVAGD